MLPHQLVLVDQLQHEDHDHRQQHAIQHLRQDDYPHQREVWPQHQARAQHDQRRVEPVEERRLLQALVQSALEAHPLAHRIRSR